jgi:hypothetical protein
LGCHGLIQILRFGWHFGGLTVSTLALHYFVVVPSLVGFGSQTFPLVALVSGVGSKFGHNKEKFEQPKGWVVGQREGMLGTLKAAANKSMLRTVIPRAFLGMATPFYAQKIPLHASRKCWRYALARLKYEQLVPM